MRLRDFGKMAAAFAFLFMPPGGVLLRTMRQCDAFDLRVDPHALGEAKLLPGAPRYPRQKTRRRRTLLQAERGENFIFTEH